MSSGRPRGTSWTWLLPLILSLVVHGKFTDAFLSQSSPVTVWPRRSSMTSSSSIRSFVACKALGDYTIELEKPLGMILEELEEPTTGGGGGGGVYVKEVTADGSAATSNIIVPGDVLLNIDGTNVETADFETVMDLIINSNNNDNKVQLTLGDGLGAFDMPKNVVKQLQSTKDAFFVDAVVRQAVREIRKNGRLGLVQKVEVIIGAGVQTTKQLKQQRGMVRFFAILSTDGVSTYSCNVAATGIRDSNDDDGPVKIVSLSCAKDEGLGQTFDLIQEKTAQ